MKKKQLSDFSNFDKGQVVVVQLPTHLVKQYHGHVSKDNTPRMVSKLNQLCIAKGFMGQGKTALGGDKYIGRYYDKQYNAVLPFPQQRDNGSSLSFDQTFQTLSGKTINNWNKYVESENQLTKFLNQMNTPQSRQQWIQNQIQNLSITSFKYKWVVTIFYAYVYSNIPKEAKQKLNFIAQSKANFLCLSKQQQQKIFNIFVERNGESVEQLYWSLSNALQTMGNQADTKGFAAKTQAIKIYVNLKANFEENVKFYLQKQGLDETYIKKILNGNVTANSSALHDKNIVRQNVIKYLTVDQTNGNQNSQSLKFVFPKSLKGQTLPPFNLVAGQQNYINSLKKLLQQDPNLSNIQIM